jgi:hypothetical protein
MRYLPLLLIAACAETPKPPEDDVPTDGKLDSFRSPTDHGAIDFGISAIGKLTDTSAYHTWTFSLSAAADVHAFTFRAPHDASIDTVLYLYKKTASGWGAYIARNDDTETSEWSSLSRSLAAGDYRALVKGYSRATKGWFLLEVDCTGAGCAPAAQVCPFGANLGDLEASTTIHADPMQRLFSSTGVSALDAQRMVLAMHESVHTDVTTVDEAFAAADQNEIDITRLTETATGHTYSVIDYGAGDNWYGAIFDADTTNIVAAIHDGDFYRCP